MIKRRYYRAEHVDKDNNGSSSSSSSSDSDADLRSSDDSEPESEPASNVEGAVQSPLRTHQPSSSSSGYESEDSSANEIDADLSGLPDNEKSEPGKDRDQHIGSLISRKEIDEIEEAQAKDRLVMENLPTCVLKCKSVYKCRLCPKIVCLNDESLKAHLESKRHSRSEKLLNDGRLKCILNSDGEEEVITDDDGETHAERHARILALAQDTSKKKGKGRQRQRQRLKRKTQKNPSNITSSGQKTENRAKRRRKNVD